MKFGSSREFKNNIYICWVIWRCSGARGVKHGHLLNLSAAVVPPAFVKTSCSFLTCTRASKRIIIKIMNGIRKRSCYRNFLGQNFPMLFDHTKSASFVLDDFSPMTITSRSTENFCLTISFVDCLLFLRRNLIFFLYLNDYQVSWTSILVYIERERNISKNITKVPSFFVYILDNRKHNRTTVLLSIVFISASISHRTFLHVNTKVNIKTCYLFIYNVW